MGKGFYREVPAAVADTTRGAGYKPVAPTGDGAEAPWSGPKGVTVADVLAYVGDDKTKAVVVLGQEQALDHPRSTLVDRLQAVLDAEEPEDPEV